jgi:hypothetical protein
MRRHWLVVLGFAAALIFSFGELRAQTVINIPRAATPPVVDANTILNLNAGGTLTSWVMVRNGGQAFIYGGRAQSITAELGGKVTILGGGIHDAFFARDGGNLYHQGGKSKRIYLEEGGAGELRGGALESLATSGTGLLLIEGTDFRVNGVPVAGLDNTGDALQLNLPEGASLSGVLADGTPFATFQLPGNDYFHPGTLTLRRSAPVSTPLPGTTTINTRSTLAYVNGNQEVRVVAGGELEEQFRAGRGSRVVVAGGRVGAAMRTVGATVDIQTGGYVARRLATFEDSRIQVNGGSLDGDSRFHRGSHLELNSGSVGAGTWIREGASMTMNGGIAYEVVAFADSDVEIHGGELRKIYSDNGRILVTGGTVVDQLGATEGANVILAGGRHTDDIRVSHAVVRGGEFRYNGQPVSLSASSPVGLALSAPPTLVLGPGDVLEGVYADGTPFVYGGNQERINGTITLEDATLPERGPDRVEVPTAPAPKGVRSGQTLVLRSGGTLPVNYTAQRGSTLEVEGGTVGNNLELAGATLKATGGQLGSIDAFMGASLSLKDTTQFSGITSYGGSQIEIQGAATKGGSLRLWDGSSLRVAGTQMQGDIEIDESTAEITNGDFKRLRLFHFSEANISGGNFAVDVQALSGSRVNATGGKIAVLATGIGDSDLEGVTTTTAVVDGAQVGRLVAAPYSSIEMKSGIAGRTQTTNQGGQLILRGGALGDSHDWLAGSVDVYGYDFQVDGVPVAGLANVGSVLNFAYQAGSAITGVLSDGTPFNIRPGDNNNSVTIRGGGVRFHRTAPVEAEALIEVPSSSAPYGATAGQTVVVRAGGELYEHFVAAQGSVLRILGGEVGENFEADRSQVTVSGGTVGSFGDAFAGSVFTINGGSVGGGFEAHAGSELRLVSGQLGSQSKAQPGSKFEMTGGALGTSFIADGADVVIKGGSVGNGFEARNATRLTIDGGLIGANFEANSGTHVVVRKGQIAGSFDVRNGATADITGGTFSSLDLRDSPTKVDVSGGTFSNLSMTDGATLDIAGGQFGLVELYRSTTTMTGGTIGNEMRLQSGAVLRVEGGAIGVSADVYSGGKLTLAGGTIGSQFHANAGATIALEGYGFKLDGIAVPGLRFDEDTVMVNQRGGAILTGFYSDGTPFTFKLNPTLVIPRSVQLLGDVDALTLAAPSRDHRYDFFAPTAVLQLTVSIPEPGSLALVLGSLAMIAAIRRKRARCTQNSGERGP